MRWTIRNTSLNAIGFSFFIILCSQVQTDMKLLLSLFLSFTTLLQSSAYAQQNVQQMESITIGNRKQGSAETLEGSTYVLTVFTGNQWEETDVAFFNNIRNEALEWLSKEALRYGKELTFTNGSFGISDPVEFDIESGTGSGKESVDIIWKVMKEIGYSSPLVFEEWAKEKTGCKNCIVLVVANKTGRSYSIGYNELYNKEKFFLEGAVFFTKYQDGRHICAASIAHEICHLFGAEDLYETFRQTKENELIAREKYPNDIMLRTSFTIEELTIDEMTAWFIGLSDKEESWYRDFIDSQ